VKNEHVCESKRWSQVLESKAIVSGGQNGRYLRRHYRLGRKEKSLEKSSKYFVCLRFKCCKIHENKSSMIVDALLHALVRLLNVLSAHIVSMILNYFLEVRLHYYWLGCLMCEDTGLSNPNK